MRRGGGGGVGGMGYTYMRRYEEGDMRWGVWGILYMYEEGDMRWGVYCTCTCMRRGVWGIHV